MTFIATIIPQGSMNESELRSEELPEDPRSRLDFLKSIVGGYIEVVGNGDGTLIICNEEGKLQGLEGNRRIRDGASVIAGTFFVVGDDGENFRSLTESEVVKYMDRFKEIEDISQDEVESDMGITFISM